MESATRVYILMLGIFGAGLWAIVSLGAVYLHAPYDLSGEWELFTDSDAADALPVHTLSIEQSGWYSRIIVDSSSRRPESGRSRIYDLKRQSPRQEFKNAADILEITLAGKGMEITFSGPAVRRRQFSVTLTGDITGTWTAVRPDPDRAAGVRAAAGATRPTSLHAGT